MKSVYLFQKDLRATNNTILGEALKVSKELIFAFIKPIDFDTNETELKFPLWSEPKKYFFIEALQHLAQILKEAGHDLYFFESNIDFAEYVKVQSIESIYFSSSPFSYENEFQKFLPSDLKLISEPTDLLIKPENLNSGYDGFTSFTKFRKVVEKYKWPVEKPIDLTSFFKSNTNTIRTNEFSDGVVKISTKVIPNFKTATVWCGERLEKLTNTEIAFNLQGDRVSALKHVDDYIWNTKHIKHYKETRNGLLNFYDSSKFSAWLALGVLSPAEIFHNISNFEDHNGSNASTYWLKLELLWREYFKWMAEVYGDQFFKSEGLTENYIEHEIDEKSLHNFMSWTKGQSKNSFINANIIELKCTGFMSNRGRQNVASYLVHELGLSWLWGAKWFESRLIDYDPASNYGNWQYISGAGGWGEHKFDFDWQAKTYDPNNEYQKFWNLRFSKK